MLEGAVITFSHGVVCLEGQILTQTNGSSQKFTPKKFYASLLLKNMESITKCAFSWSVKKRVQAYSNKTKRCHLCLEKRVAIINADKSTTLNRRTELVSKCRHENKFYLI